MTPSSTIARIVVGEEIGVGGAEIGAIRRSEVGQLLVADRLPQPVHVPRHVGRGEMGQEVGVALAAATGKLLERRVAAPRSPPHRWARWVWRRRRRCARQPWRNSARARSGRRHAGRTRRSRTARAAAPAARRTCSARPSTPEPPGPPGLVIREPMRPAWSVAGPEPGRWRSLTRRVRRNRAAP